MNAPDPYEPTVSFWEKNAQYVWAAIVLVVTTALTVASFPPLKTPEFAYAFAAPAVLWAYRRPSFKLYVVTLGAAQVISWTILLFWLHHVTWVGLFLLAPFIGIWVGLWYLAVWWAVPRMREQTHAVRVAVQMGLAGRWVVNEWSRTWVLTGFPWLPLAVSQWQRPVILQIAAFTGAYGVSFVLIAMNLGFAAYAHRLFFEDQAIFSGNYDEELPRDGFALLKKRSQEFWVAVFLLLSCLCIFLVEVQPFVRRIFERPLARIAFVQPKIPQAEKWDAAQGPSIITTFRDLTLKAGHTHPDLIVWPEASMPWPVKGDQNMKSFVEHVSASARSSLMLGAVGINQATSVAPEQWFNGAFLVTPKDGLEPKAYAKRHMVPFGEYIPLRPILGWLSKVVPIGSDFTPGQSAEPFVVTLPMGSTAFGTLICYEDVYPSLARENVLAGSDVLFVPTNDAWYGEEGAAVQHAAHSVLRAVETRRPVIRDGNAGWSGWIDEFGIVRFHVQNADGNIYLRTTQTVDVERDSRWIGKLSFYVQFGDWFVIFAAALAFFGYTSLRSTTVKRSA